jgi:hypothetical protein
MRTRSLVLIALRLYAIYWFFQSLSQLAFALPLLFYAPSVLAKTPWFLAVIPAVMLVFSIALWVCATQISSVVVRGYDAELSTVTLTREDLYCFAFVFLGLYFILSSIPAVSDAGYKFLTEDAMLPESDVRRGREIVPFFGHTLTLLIGFGCVLGASKWSRKLARRDEGAGSSIR